MFRVLATGVRVLVLAVIFAALVSGQANNGRNATIYVQATTPPSADVGYFWYDTSAGTLKIAVATSPVVWSAVGGSSGGGLPSGSIVLVASGTCPAGTTELQSLDGQTLVGTIAANANVGTTGGSNTLTPLGSIAAPTVAWPAAVPTHAGIAATFTGTALAAHAHELPFQIPTTTSVRQIAAGTFGTGTARAATAAVTTTAATTSAAVALSQAVTAGTPAGTVTVTSQGTIAWPASVPTASAPAFTGTPADNRSAFTRVIFCQAS